LKSSASFVQRALPVHDNINGKVFSLEQRKQGLGTTTTAATREKSSPSPTWLDSNEKHYQSA